MSAVPEQRATWRMLGKRSMAAVFIVRIFLIIGLSGPCSAQLKTQPPNCAANPVAGQGQLPGNYTFSNYPVDTEVHIVNLLGVDESKYTADLFLWWELQYDDDASVAALQANYSSCNLYCNVRMSSSLNEAGQPSCCDNVFIPQAQAINSRGYFDQNYAESYRVEARSDTRIFYLRSFQGKFQYAWDSGAFPFDRHYILVDIRTAFMPKLVRGPDNAGLGANFGLVDGFAQLGANKLRVTTNPDYYRPEVTGKPLPEWEVVDIFMEVIEFTRKFTRNPQEFVLSEDEIADDPSDLEAGSVWRPPGGGRYGVRVYILIKRKTTGFWTVTCVVPVTLVTVFGFGVQSLPRQSLKARTELLSTLFLSLVLLQTVLYQFLPPVYVLCLPLLLVLVGYVYTLLLYLVIISAHTIEFQWRRRQLKLQRRWASQMFSRWSKGLQQGPGAQAALSQSSARFAVPFEVAQPRLGSCKPSLEGDGSGPSPEIAADVEWLNRQLPRWYFPVPCLRTVAEWWRFIGLAESQDYCRWAANRFDQGMRLFLLLSYVVVVLVLCLITSADSDVGARSLVFPPGSFLANQ